MRKLKDIVDEEGLVLVGVLILAVVIALCMATSAHSQTFAGRRARPPLNSGVTYTNVVPDVLWWKMNEGSGTALTGDAAASDDGTHDADYTTGIAGNGLDFNGSSDDAVSTSGLAISGTNIVTVAGWLKFDTTQNCILWTTCGDPYGSCNNQQFYATLESSIFYFALQDSASGKRRSTLSLASSGIATGTWYHWLIVFDQAANSSAGKVSVYIDGSQKTMTNETETNTKTLNSNFAANTLIFGQRSAPDRWFDGKADDFRIYTGDQSALVLNILNNKF